jgi:hypothetical protein
METFVRRDGARTHAKRAAALTPLSASTVESGALDLHVQYMGQPVYYIPLVRRCRCSESVGGSRSRRVLRPPN